VASLIANRSAFSDLLNFHELRSYNGAITTRQVFSAGCVASVVAAMVFVAVVIVAVVAVVAVATFGLTICGCIGSGIQSVLIKVNWFRLRLQRELLFVRAARYCRGHSSHFLVVATDVTAAGSTVCLVVFAARSFGPRSHHGYDPPISWFGRIMAAIHQ
jgi:hypothetical protein